MKKIDTDTFNQLVDEKKFDEAKELLRDFFEEEMSETDEGEYYVEMMTEYLRMSNLINEAYIAEMQDLKAKLKEVDEIGNKVSEVINLEQIRGDIEKL